MSKLIGTNPNQVPSNADLGTAAFMDKKEFLLSKGSEMSAIDAVISNTALDVFVYDTTKDSDGGAWRKRTQHTSWYNEKLNTTTRGSRKEFPAVAVIVMEYASATGSSAMTIYDGDDPTLPMWMSCQVAGNTRWIRYNGTIRSVAALNGIILAGANGADLQDSLLSRMDLICDKLERHFDGGTHQIDSRGIVHRNSNFIITSNGAQNIVSRYVNDVAMTVLPNAPIDAATGLPTPTVVIATQSGVTVIQNNGSVRNLSGGVYGTVNAFGEYFVAKGSGDDLSVMRWDSTDTIINYTKGTYRFNGNPATGYHPFLYGNGGKILAVDHTKRIHHLTGVTGLTTWDIDGGVSDRNSLQNNIKNNFNTGWMVGDTKLATLSDTDATNLPVIPFSDDFSNSDNWTHVDTTISGGTLNLASVTSARASNNNWNGVTGNQYVVKINVTAITGVIRLDDDGAGGGAGSTTTYATISSTGIQYFHITKTASARFRFLRSSGSASITEIEVRNKEPDRSVNNNGLQVFGTVTKTAVATGADLVSYSGFSTSNYLEQPYNSDMNFTTDMSISYWIKGGGASQSLMDRGSGTRYSAYSWHIYHDGGSDYRLTLHSNGATEQQFEIADVVGTSTWQHVVWTLSGGIVKGYWNGDEKSSASFSGTLTTQSSNPIRIGTSPVATASHSGELALIRISGTAPSAEQIAKMYNDEKHLFQENAKATLYGTSDAVTALAYDDDTELLHVGTSAGRSDFQGLRRINNTTRAIGTAISAVDGFIVEE